MTEEMPRTIEDLQVGMALNGTVKKIELGGAVVDIGIGIDGFLHISQLGRSHVRNVEDVVKVGDTITVYVLEVYPANRRIALSLERRDDLAVGKVVKGKVTRLEKYGVFVDIGAERPGMIHVSELAAGYVQQPSDVVKVGDEVQAQVININPKQKRIDLSIKKLHAAAEAERPARQGKQQAERIEEEIDERAPTAMEYALRRAMDDSNYDYELPFPIKSDGKRNKRDKRDRRERRDRDYEDIFERTLRGR